METALANAVVNLVPEVVETDIVIRCAHCERVAEYGGHYMNHGIVCDVYFCREHKPEAFTQSEHKPESFESGSDL